MTRKISGTAVSLCAPCAVAQGVAEMSRSPASPGPREERPLPPGSADRMKARSAGRQGHGEDLLAGLRGDRADGGHRGAGRDEGADLIAAARPGAGGAADGGGCPRRPVRGGPGRDRPADRGRRTRRRRRKPPAPALIAVNVVSGPGELIGTCRQLIPPSSESSAIGTVPAGVVAWPTAATRFPLMAICCRTADEAPAGTGRTIVVQVVPLAVVHTAGLPSCDPTDTKPAASAATAST